MQPWIGVWGVGFTSLVGVRMRGPPGDIDPLNKVPFKGAIK